MKNKFGQRSCRKGNSGPRVEKQKNISGKRKLKSRVFIHVYYLWIFSISNLEKTQAICFEEINASCQQQKKTEKEGVEEQHQLHYCLWGGEAGLEVKVASFQTYLCQQCNTFIHW